MFFLALSLIIIGISTFAIFFFSRKTTKSNDKDFKGGVKKKKKEKKHIFTSLQITWEESEDSKRVVDRLVKYEDYKPLKLEIFKYPHHYVLPTLSQSPLSPEDTIDENTRIRSDQFERFSFQPFYNPNIEKLCGLLRFNLRCCGPSVINDMLEQDCVNGGATLTFGIEMIRYFSKLVDSDNIFTDKPFIEFDMEKNGKKVSDVEIEYLQPIPLHGTYKFECDRDPQNPHKFEVNIIGIGSQRTKYATIKATIYHNEDEEMYNFSNPEDDNNTNGIDHSSLEIIKNEDRYPIKCQEVLDDLKKEVDDESNDLKVLQLQFYETMNPKEFKHGKLGAKYVVQPYFLVSKEQESLRGDRNLYSYKYVLIKSFFSFSKQETILIMVFGENTADPMMNNVVHQGVISTALDNYSALHVNICVFPMITTSFTKVLKLVFNSEYDIKRFEFVKLVIKYNREREVMMGERKAVLGTVKGVLYSLDEKRRYAELETLFTSLEQKRE